MTIKRERAPFVKNENDIINVPFETTEVCRGSKNDTNQQLENQIANLTEEKDQLINDLIAAKDENQKLYAQVKSKQQKILAYEIEKTKQQKLNAELTSKQQTMVSTHENQQRSLQKELCELRNNIAQLTRDNKNLQAKIKQLMVSASAEIEVEKTDTAVENSNEYEVEAILNHKIKRGQRTYLIRWKGFPPNYDTWENESNLKCPEILNMYLKSKGL